MSRTIRLAGALALATTLAACDSSSGPSQGSAVSLAIATRGTAVAPTAGGPQFSGAPVEYTDGTNTLVINSVEMVVKEVELKRSEFTSTCDSTASDDECEELESGPYLLDLPLSGGATSVVTVDVLPGTYDEFEFKIHKPSDDAENAAFLAAHPDFEGVSVRVTGTWNGAAFTYETDVSAEQELDLVPPLVVTDVGTSDFTLYIDIATWFRANDNSLIDPSSANKGGQNESVVNSNITSSFDAFEDEDHDGHDDHGED
jgi:hypothetical protein